MAMLWDILSELETLADNYPDSDAQKLYDRLCEAKDEIASALRDIAYFHARRQLGLDFAYDKRLYGPTHQQRVGQYYRLPHFEIAVTTLPLVVTVRLE